MLRPRAGPRVTEGSLLEGPLVLLQGQVGPSLAAGTIGLEKPVLGVQRTEDDLEICLVHLVDPEFLFTGESWRER